MNQKVYQGIKKKFSVVETEVWDLSNDDSRIVDPTLDSETYGWGIAIYLVPTGYCSNL